MAVLEVVIGLVFAFLLLSLLGTVIQEFIATLISLRGRVLLDALVKMIEQEENKDYWKKLIKNSKVFKKFGEEGLVTRYLPSYLTSDQVIAVLQDILDSNEAAASAGEGQARGLGGPVEATPAPAPTMEMREGSLGNSLRMLQVEKSQMAPMAGSRGLGGGGLEAAAAQLPAELQAEIDKAKAAVARNFNELMERVTGWYKRRVQFLLLVIGLVVAAAFDADTFDMYHTLSVDPEARQQILAVANNFVNENRIERYTPADSLSEPVEDTVKLQITRAKIDSLISVELGAARSPLGLGRTAFPEPVPDGVKNPTLWRLQKFFGWMITAFAISLGASFWFDLLKMLMNIRNAGNPPAESGSK